MSKNPACPAFAFPADLAQAQRDLHRAQADHAAHGRTLPWSADPDPGWPAVIHETTKKVLSPAREPSPGYTSEQRADDDRLRALVLELSVVVSTHPYWATVERGEAVAARQALKTLGAGVPEAGAA
ncbi:hypothetical protein [Streptomyces sp. NPDC094049]|uniref:hypothetical protein n=1 Tax=Streptomyces sp. NPDC094049 TaxID=3154987 RepID=UPI0033330F7C